MGDRKELSLILGLTRIKGITPLLIKRLMDSFGNPAEIFQSDRNRIARVLEPVRNSFALAELIRTYRDFEWAERELERADRLGIRILSMKDEDYPVNLRFIPDPPPVIYITGSLLPEDSVGLAVVGTRRYSSYGRLVTEKLVGDLAGTGITIVSGLARGIDSIAHTKAISSGIRNIAVMATGADITYPPENAGLRKKIEENGAVITEFPLGSLPDRWRFPVRNRIIAGLSLGVLVVEAPVKSGALITARLAMEYNRELFALPGNINSPNSAGCNGLIRDGVKPVTCVADILEEMEMDFYAGKDDTQAEALNSEERALFDIIDSEGVSAELLTYSSGIPPERISALLLEMELKGLIRRMPGNIYFKSDF